MIRVSQDDKNEFRKMANMLWDSTFNLVFKIISDDETAKDITQDCLLILWRNREKLSTLSNFEAWFYKVVVNKCYDFAKSQKSRSRLFTKVENSLDQAQSTIENHDEELKQVLKTLSNLLTPKQKLVFVLHDIEEKTPDEISELTSLNKDSIKSNLHLARKTIASYLEKTNYERRR